MSNASGPDVTSMSPSSVIFAMSPPTASGSSASFQRESEYSTPPKTVRPSSQTRTDGRTDTGSKFSSISSMEGGPARNQKSTTSDSDKNRPDTAPKYSQALDSEDVQVKWRRDPNVQKYVF